MRRTWILALFLLGLACLSGWLMQKPSLIGRVGISLLYKEYQFLRTWWKTAALETGLYFLILLLLEWLRTRLAPTPYRILLSLLFLAGLAGFYLTWNDFHDTSTHRWLKERFHMGAYLFWIGFLALPVFYFFQPGNADANERRHIAV